MATIPPETPAGAPSAPMDDHDALPPGTRFGELEILRVLGIGGFGIVYLAMDHALEREVALKEYMPGSLAGRGKGQMVSIRSGAHTETYALGLRSFVNEARLLARFNHPSLVKVYRFWEENGTAYMVMPYLQGRTLRDVRRSMTEAPTEAWIRSVINPILDALELLHREGVYHRDIAPDNILLPPGELPVLLDFGAARRAIGDHTQTFTAILKPSYAPIEQYAEVVQLRQGPWTDLYALGAVVFYLLRGSPPPPATARAVQDDVPLLIHEDFPALSEHFLAAIDWALAIRPSERPQNIAALREVFDGRQPAPPRARSGITVPPNRGGFGIDAGGVETGAFAPTMRVSGQATEIATEIATARMDRGLTRPDPTRPEPRAEPTRTMAVPRKPAAEPEVDQTVVLTRPPGGTQPPRSRVEPSATHTAYPPTPARAPPPKAAPAAPVALQPAPAPRRGVLMATLGVFVLLGAAGAYMLGTRSSTPPVVAPPVAAASEPLIVTRAPAPPPVVAPVAAPVLPPAVVDTPVVTAPTTTTVVQTPDARAAASPLKAPASATLPASLGPISAAASKPSAPRAKDILARPAPRADGALQPLPEQRVVEQRPAQPHPEEVAPRPSPVGNVRPLPLPLPLPVPPAPVRQGPVSPREACGSRVFLALALCMEEQCETQRFRAHPQCDAVRQMTERRRRGGD